MNPDSVSHLWVKDIKDNDQVRGEYLVKSKRMGSTRKGDPFMSLTLADRSGEIEARVWERASSLSSLFSEGDILEIEGAAGSYRGEVQLTLSDLKTVKEVRDPSLFIEVSQQDVTKMMLSLREVLRKIENPQIKSLTERFLSDSSFVQLLKKAPAAKNFHHSTLGGLLEHTLSVCRLALLVSEHYPELNRDLLLAGAFLHDIGKVRELNVATAIDYTDEGRLIGHLSLGVSMVDEKLAAMESFPEEIGLRLKHLILSHHGEYEFGSPKKPAFLEAFALHLIDDLDAKINGLGRFM
ncbi:MAG: 3'-5' exoribonuclease YhaM family protein, partial [Deltaproteobacteria bacterium]